MMILNSGVTLFVRAVPAKYRTHQIVRMHKMRLSDGVNKFNCRMTRPIVRLFVGMCLLFANAGLSLTSSHHC